MRNCAPIFAFFVDFLDLNWMSIIPKGNFHLKFEYIEYLFDEMERNV